MKSLTLDAFRQRLNDFGRRREACFFLVDFELQQPLCWALSDVKPDELRYDFNGQSNHSAPPALSPTPSILEAFPLSPKDYEAAFEVVQRGLGRGDSFLTNLTFPTPIELTTSENKSEIGRRKAEGPNIPNFGKDDRLFPDGLSSVFAAVQARYRLWLRDRFVCFSPETFVRIERGRIHTFPMKGTRPADPAGNDARLLADPKERAEHATIVDLLRNDLSTVARRVRVERYRYLEKIETSRGGLWQTSSTIVGDLPTDFHHHLGDLLLRLLPAGSVSGAPKPSTLALIREAEGQERGYYTGVAGLWDGERLDSTVLIRFIEETDRGYRYWSGGGITAYSQWEEEYQELIGKIYLPLNRKQFAKHHPLIKDLVIFRH